MITVDIVSDIVCPWCFIGLRRLDAALAEVRQSVPDFECQKVWRPFFLNPNTPPEGEPYLPFLERKFGGRTQVEALFERVRSAGHLHGVAFAFEKIQVRANTLNAHRLIHWAQQRGEAEAQLDDLNAAIATRDAAIVPNSVEAQQHAQFAQQQARRSAEESGLIEALPQPPQEISEELKLAYRRAAKLIHPDRATSEPERLRRTTLMAEVNRAYETSDLKAIEKLIAEFGQDPEAIAGDDVGSRIVKSIRRIAQLRRRLHDAQMEIDTMKNTEICQLKIAIEEAESRGGDPLGDLSEQLMREVSERTIQLNAAKPQ